MLQLTLFIPPLVAMVFVNWPILIKRQLWDKKNYVTESAKYFLTLSSKAFKAQRSGTTQHKSAGPPGSALQPFLFNFIFDSRVFPRKMRESLSSAEALCSSPSMMLQSSSMRDRARSASGAEMRQYIYMMVSAFFFWRVFVCTVGEPLRRRCARVIAIGQMVAMENPTCIARLVQFKVVAVATQPRFHYNSSQWSYHWTRLLSWTVVKLDVSVKWLERVKCVLLNRTYAFYSYDEGIWWIK